MANRRFVKPVAPLAEGDDRCWPGAVRVRFLKIHLWVLVFVSGMTTLAVELSASRLLAPYFGTSLLIWANLIGLILIYLTLGYYLGGRLADRRPDHAVLCQIIAWAGFLIGLIPFIAQPVFRLAFRAFATVSAGLFISSLVGVLALFAVPIILLGTVSPFAIRLAMRDVERAGNVAGSFYALSTLGSILGTFLPVLVLIPAIGTRRTFLSFSVLLLAASIIGLVPVSRRLALGYSALLIVVLGLGAWFADVPIKPTQGLLYETESPYHYIQVFQRDGTVYLGLNEGGAVHSMYNPRLLLTDGVWDFFLLAPYFAPNVTPADVRSLAIIGLAGGTVARQYTAIYGPIPIDGVEIDPDVLAVGRRYFNLTMPNLRTFVQDGRLWLASSQGRYDVVVVDAYRQPYVPFHLTTVEFFQEVRRHLTDNGVVAINVLSTPEDQRLVDALASTMAVVFPSVYVIDVPTTFNSLVIATVQPSSLADYADNMVRLTDPRLLNVARRAAGHVRAHPGGGLVFTDDWAPVEQVTDQLILHYVLAEEKAR